MRHEPENCRVHRNNRHCVLRVDGWSAVCLRLVVPGGMRGLREPSLCAGQQRGAGKK